jgi:hypothetical protein
MIVSARYCKESTVKLNFDYKMVKYQAGDKDGVRTLD